MGYLHIENLYRDTRLLAFKEVFALEKVHGTSAHLTWQGSNQLIQYSSGGMNRNLFLGIFNDEELREKFIALGHETATIKIFGEAYGSKEQGMSQTYGKAPGFIAFDVEIDHPDNLTGPVWLAVPQAENLVQKLGLEFVPYALGPATLEWLDEQRDADSIVAINRGMGPGKKREGIVIRPPFEVRLNNGGRLISKHKRAEFRETKTQREVDPESLKILEQAEEIAEEWVTEMRLSHVLQKIDEPHTMEIMLKVLDAMLEDVLRESTGEIVDSREARKAISKQTSKLYKAYLLRKPPE